MTPRRARILVLLLIAGCSRAESDQTDKPLARTRVPVGLATVVRDSLVEELALTGRLVARPGGAALLAAPAAGVVRAVRVQVGDRVHRGQSLIELDVPELAADAEQRASAAAQAERQAERQRRLLADGIASARQAEEAAAAARQASAAASAARDLLARTRVTSPISGRVQDILAQPGERVEAGKALAQVIAGDTLDLMAAVPARSLGRLKPGQTAQVLQEGDPTPHPAWVAGLAPGVDSLTGAGAAVVRVPNPGGALRVGAGAEARVRTGVRRDVLLVPDSALVLRGDSSVVFVVGTDSIAHARPVARGARSGGRSEVAGDLHPGDRVVTTGAFGLEDGMGVAPTGDAAR